MVGLILVVFLFSVVQSLFGVGLLLFGTPTLLLMGYDFSHVLAYLLPASLTISLLQRFSSTTQVDPKFRKQLWIWCLPFVAVALGLKILFLNHVHLEIVIALFLLLAGGLRISPPLFRTLQRLVIHYEVPYLIFMGMVHGFTNMGGSFLSVLSSSLYQEKKSILGAISLGYLYFAMIQLITLLVFDFEVFSEICLICMVVAGSTYGILGRRLLKRISESRYQMIFTIFIFMYAVLLLKNALPHILFL